MKRATVFKPIQFLFCALLCFFGASEAHAVMTTHAQGVWVSGANVATSLGWRSHYIDATGLYYMGARYYAPDSGTFLSPDPLGHGASWDLYSYCNGDPINNYDPDGRFGKGQDAGNAGMISSGDPNSPAFYAGLLTQSVWNGAGTGAQNGAGGAINAVSGYSGAFGSDPSSSGYTLGRNTIYTGEAAVITVGTGGLALEAAGGMAAISANALYYGPAAATFAYHVGNAITGETPAASFEQQLSLPAPSVVPNAGGVIRSFAQEADQIYYRVFSGSQKGEFLTAVSPGSSAFAQEALALPSQNTAAFIQQVLVPAGTRLQRSRALPNFGHQGGGEQFQLLHKIPDENFGEGVPLQ